MPGIPKQMQGPFSDPDVGAQPDLRGRTQDPQPFQLASLGSFPI